MRNLFLVAIVSFFVASPCVGQNASSAQDADQKFFYFNGYLDELLIGTQDEKADLRLTSDIQLIHSPEITCYYHFEKITGTYPTERRVYLSVKVPKVSKYSFQVKTKHGLQGKTNSYTVHIYKNELSKDGRKLYLITKSKYYQDLIEKNGRQGGFYQSLLQGARDQLLEEYQYQEIISPQRRPSWDQWDEFSFLSGNIAMEENLSLSRALQTNSLNEKRNIPIHSVPTVTVKPIHWDGYLEGFKPELDPLSRFIPYDQHVFLFSTYNDFRSIRESFRQGFSVYSSLFNEKEIDSTITFYQKQLGIDFHLLEHSGTDKLIQSVAVTGSDFHFLEGTDVAILLQCSDSANVFSKLKTIGDEIGNRAGAKTRRKTIEGHEVYIVSNSNRTVCRYMTKNKNTIFVSNSEPQMKKLLRVVRQKHLNLSELQEFHYFRTKFMIGQPESAFLFLSDGAIRRWCHPKWRIGGDRRAKARRKLQSVSGQFLLNAKNVRNTVRMTENDTGIVPFQVKDHQVISEKHGTLQFQTPIIELQIDKVSKREKTAYEDWLDRYQNNQWSQGFDPIGIRIHLGQTKERKQKWFDTDIDILVMPLKDSTSYDALRDLIAEKPVKRFNPALFPGQIGLISFGELSEWSESFVLRMVPKELQDAKNVAGQFGLTQFRKNGESFAGNELIVQFAKPFDLESVKKWIKNSDDFETYRGTPIADERHWFDSLYAADKATIVFCDKSTAKKRIDFILDKKNQDSDPYGMLKWLNSKSSRIAFGFFPDRLPTRGNLNSGGFIDPISPIKKDFLSSIQKDILLLNQWKKVDPTGDPIENHFKAWNRTIAHPEGGSFVWNSKAQTYESTTFGHPFHWKPFSLRNHLFGKIDAIFGVLDFPNAGLSGSLRFRKKLR